MSSVVDIDLVMKVVALQEERGLLEARVRMMAAKSNELSTWLQQVQQCKLCNSLVSTILSAQFIMFIKVVIELITYVLFLCYVIV